ncbi:MAG: hypothetical protein R6U17_04185, partial [Thermoplasmata archaeon]
SYVSGRPEHFNDLHSWDRTMGIWIRVTDHVTLTVAGTAPVNTSVTLEPGWNMVSLPSSTAGNHDLPAEVTKVGYFYAPAEYNLVYTTEVSSFEFEPGKGYWVYNGADVSVQWTVGY